MKNRDTADEIVIIKNSKIRIVFTVREERLVRQVETARMTRAGPTMRPDHSITSIKRVTKRPANSFDCSTAKEFGATTNEKNTIDPVQIESRAVSTKARASNPRLAVGPTGELITLSLGVLIPI